MRVSLPDVCKEIFAGGDVPKGRFSKEKTDCFNVPVFANAEQDDGLYGYTDKARVFEESVTVAARGTIGYTSIRREPFLPVVRLITVIPDKEKVDLDYLYYALRNHRSASSGTSIPQLTVPEIKKYSFNLIVDSKRQKEVVLLLSCVEEVIEKQKKEILLLDELIKARFVEMFGDMVLNPNCWSKDRLGEVCDVRDGTHDSPQYYSDGYPLVTSKNVTAGHIDLADCSFINEEDYRKINQRSKVDYGDILMPMIGTVGRPVIVNIKPEFAIKNVALIKFKPDSKVLNTFVKAVLESDYFDNAVLDKVRGGTQKFISLGDIRKLEVYLPPIEVQKKFEDLLGQVDKSKVAVQKSLDEAQLLFDSLMQKYFG